MLKPAKTKTEEIIHHLNDMKIGDESNRFLLRRYRNDAKALEKDRPVEAYEICAAIACLENNIEEMRSWHQKAITVSGNDPVVIVNYAMSLGKLGFYLEAHNKFKEVLEENSANIYKLLYIRSCHDTGLFFEAYECFRHMSVEDIEEVGLPEDIIVGISEAVNILAAKGVSDDDISKAIVCVEECFQNQGVFEVRRDVSIYSAKEFILYGFSFSFNGVDLLELDYQIEKKLEESGVSEDVLSVLEFDFVMLGSEKVAQDVVPISKEKIDLVKALVAPVEI